jgi:hypothetical protein
VLQALHKVANLGRSVVCTIHQPSTELFFHFDDLLLLQVGFSFLCLFCTVRSLTVA